MNSPRRAKRAGGMRRRSMHPEGMPPRESAMSTYTQCLHHIVFATRS